MGKQRFTPILAITGDMGRVVSANSLTVDENRRTKTILD